MTDPGAADEWDVVVPEDGEQLLAELRRHGVVPGQSVRVRSATSGGFRSADTSSGAIRAKTTGAVRSSSIGHFESGGKNAGGGQTSDDPPTMSEAEPDFIGSFDSGRPDLAERSEDILRAHFPDR